VVPTRPSLQGEPSVDHPNASHSPGVSGDRVDGSVWCDGTGWPRKRPGQWEPAQSSVPWT
jgi:hypothetical protein